MRAKAYLFLLLTVILSILTPGVVGAAREVPFFSQRDSRWAGDYMGSSGCTIEDCGCIMVDTAMLLKFYGVDTDPGILNTWLSDNNGYTSGGELYWNKPAEYSNGKMEYIDSLSWTSPPPYSDNDHWSDLYAQLVQGYPIIVKVDAYLSTPKLESHWVLVTSFAGGDIDDPYNYYINDPWDLSFDPDKRLSHYYDSVYDNTFFATKVYHGTAATIPEPPILLSPGTETGPGPEVADLTPTFQWNSGADATDYGLYIRNLNTDVLVFNSEEDYGTITRTQFTLPSNHALEYGTQYRWNMASHNSAGWSYDLGTGYSEKLYFTTPAVGEFDRKNVISDEEFRDLNSMTLSQVQMFLETWDSELKEENLYLSYNFSYTEYPYFYNYVLANGKLGRQSSPTEVIYYSARDPQAPANHVNPQVLLVTLQKEQSLIESHFYSAELQNRLDAAMGYACPDVGGPDPQYRGFFNQVISAAYQMTQAFEARSAGVQPAMLIDGEWIYPANRATAVLYEYTPHFHGNYNFYLLYNKYFPKGVVTPPTVETRPATPTGVATEVTLNAEIMNDGGASINERRFDWGTTSSCSDGSTADVIVSDNSFSYRLTGLEPGTTYYFRGRAHNSAGWGEGNVLTFTLPSVDAFDVTHTSVNLDDSFEISYTVSDTGGSHLKQVELWRRKDAEDWPSDPIQTSTDCASYDSYTGGFYDAPSLTGTYWYGVHIVNNEGFWSVERDPPGPVKVTVTPLSPPVIGDFCGADFGPPDGYVDVWDLMQFADHWHTRTDDPDWDSKFDLAGPDFGDTDGYVDVWDLMVFADHWHEGVKP